MGSRVENRRSDGSLPVVIRQGFRLVTSVRFGLVLFPVPAHRTGLADFPHPALGKDSRFRPRKVRGPAAIDWTKPNTACRAASGNRLYAGRGSLCLSHNHRRSLRAGMLIDRTIGLADWPQTEVVGPADHHPVEPLHDSIESSQTVSRPVSSLIARQMRCTRFLDGTVPR